MTIAKDWMSRAFASYMIWTKGNYEERKNAELSLSRLLPGANAMNMDRKHTDVKQFFDKFLSELIKKLLKTGLS